MGVDETYNVVLNVFTYWLVTIYLLRNAPACKECRTTGVIPEEVQYDTLPVLPIVTTNYTRDDIPIGICDVKRRISQYVHPLHGKVLHHMHLAVILHSNTK